MSTLRAAPVSLLLVLLAVQAASAGVIDIAVFDSTQMASVGPGVFANPATAWDSTANNAPLGVGKQREFIVRRTGGQGRIQMDIDTTYANALSFSSSGDAVGRGLVTWDGPDTAVSIFNPLSGIPAQQRGEPNTFGLTGSGPTGGIDLTDGGTNNAIVIQADADNVGLPVIFNFYRSAGVYASYTLQVPGGAAFNLNWEPMMFSAFSGFGLSGGETVLDIFRDTKAITMQIDGLNASDATFDNMRAQYVPEPASLITMLGGLGLLILGRIRSR